MILLPLPVAPPISTLSTLLCEEGMRFAAVFLRAPDLERRTDFPEERK